MNALGPVYTTSTTVGIVPINSFCTQKQEIESKLIEQDETTEIWLYTKLLNIALPAWIKDTNSKGEILKM